MVIKAEPTFVILTFTWLEAFGGVTSMHCPVAAQAAPVGAGVGAAGDGVQMIALGAAVQIAAGEAEQNDVGEGVQNTVGEGVIGVVPAAAELIKVSRTPESDCAIIAAVGLVGVKEPVISTEPTSGPDV